MVHSSPSSPSASSSHQLDKLDRAIVQRLQVHALQTFDELGAQIGLSPSAVQRRVKRLEEAGVIDRYVALLRPERLGLGLTAYLNVRLEKHRPAGALSPRDAFAQSVCSWPEVLECATLTGDMDYLLLVVVSDMQHYRRFVMDCLLQHPCVLDCKTSFVLDRLKHTTAFPV